ncbi:MAG: T9SS type A sorting domain-containing protein [Bacteroidetes bacterium]|nr:T9SS type A sorting domain-containing protein [Bacteroidota bacterium]
MTAHPNPFNSQAHFTQVAEQQIVRLAVYDPLGRQVATPHNGTLAAGPAHAFMIDYDRRRRPALRYSRGLRHR